MSEVSSNHTWGQTMVFHPHIHTIVPAGGLDKLGNWKESKKKIFIPVKVLSRKFRGKFLYYLKQEKLEFYGSNEYLKVKENFDELIAKMYQKKWNFGMLENCKKKRIKI